MVLTERTQLAASYAAEVEHVPQQDHGAAREALVERYDFTRRRRQGEARRDVANVNRWTVLIVYHRRLL
jgi:hypothetical protein